MRKCSVTIVRQSRRGAAPSAGEAANTSASAARSVTDACGRPKVPPAVAEARSDSLFAAGGLETRDKATHVAGRDDLRSECRRDPKLRARPKARLSTPEAPTVRVDP